MAKAESKQLNDLLSSFPYGMNSGIDPILLPKQQSAFAVNTTFRGGYATDRPPLRKLTLDFSGSASLQTAVRTGFFQGAGVYRPDFGSSQIIAQISGRLFTFTENGSSWRVAEITIFGDPNDAATSQVWMWQAEKWMIISDGSAKLPIFYDGVVARRSLGESHLLTTAIATDPATAPAVGDTIVLTLTTAYTGPVNIPVTFNNKRYEVVSAIESALPPTPGPAYLGVLEPVYELSPLASIVPSQITVQPDRVGVMVAAAQIDNYTLGNKTIQLGTVNNVAVGDHITPSVIGGDFTVVAITGNILQISFVYSGNLLFNFPTGTIWSQLSTQGPVVTLGKALAILPPDLSTPAPLIKIAMDQQYSGPASQPVWIGTNQYKLTGYNEIVTGGGPLVPYLILSNVTDTPSAAITSLTVTSISEIPACRMGAYGLGQNWFSAVDGLSFGPSDLVGASSGSPAFNYRDAVLRTTDLDVMGMFKIPVAGEIITAMIFVATLDQALGQGPLQIGVPSGIFSCRTPFTLQDFQGITNAVTGDLVTAPVLDPILTKSLVGFGPVAQNSTVLANSDTIFRSFEGVNSLILARRNFSDIGGNTPISREMSRIIDRDNKSLLSYSSAIVFDNRLRMTCSPQVSAQGVFHMGEMVLNYDLISSLRGKASPVWDGLWTGTNVFQFIQGMFGPTSRAFSFTFNITQSQIELYELLPSGVEFFDNGNVLIKWVVETPVIFNSDVKNLVDMARLIDGELYLSDVIWQVNVVVKYRPLFYACWIPWHSFSVCADFSKDNSQDQVRYALGLGEPNPRDCDPINDQPFRDGNGFQLRLEFEGHCKLWGAAQRGERIALPAFNKPAGTCTDAPPICLSNICTVPDDLETYSLDGLPATPLPSGRIIPRTPPVPASEQVNPPEPPIVPPPTPPTPPSVFTNDTVYYHVDCAPGTTLTFTP